MKLTKLAMRRPVTTMMFFLCFLVTGAMTSKLLPLEYFPAISFPGIFIQVPYPNSSAEEIEETITRPMEEVLATMSSIKTLYSTTTDNNAQIFLQFDWEQNARIKGVEAREKIDAIRGELPQDMQRYFVFTGGTGDMPVLQLRISSQRDLSNAYDLLDRKLKRPIERIDGVSKVDLYGVDKRQIKIQLNADRITAHNIDLNDLNRRLQQENFSLSAGLITDGNFRYRVKPQGEYASIEDIENLVINQQGLRLSDIAEIVREQPIAFEGRHLDGDYAIGMSVTREANANLVEVATQVIAAIEAAESDPAFEGIKLFTMDNQAEGVTSSLRDISYSGIIGFVLSIVVLYFFLREITSTLIVALAVPFSLTITLAFMFFLDVSLNILSMMGLMLAIGMLVDNAVVVTESIFRYQEKYPDDNQKAISLGVKEVGTAVFAGTITTAIVFLPNIVGEKVDVTVFLSHVATTIVIALGASLFIALTVIPLLLSKFKIKNLEKSSPFINRLTIRYEKFLRWSLSRPKLSGLMALLIVCSVAIPAQFVTKDNYVDDTKRRLFLPYNIDSQYTIERVEKAVDTIEGFLYSHQDELDIDTVYSYYRSDLAQSTILLKEKEGATKSVTEIRDFIEKNLPKIAIGNPTFERNRGQQEGVKIYVSGDSTEVLRDLSNEVARVINTVDGVYDARSEATSKDREVQVIVNRVKAQTVGLDPSQVASMIAIAMRGQPLRSYRGNDREVDMILEFGKQDRQSLGDLKHLMIPRPGQDAVPLSSIAEFNIKQASNTIQRRDRRTSIGIVANLDEGITLDQAKEKIKEVMKTVSLPSGYQWNLGQAFQREQDADNVMLWNMLLAILMIFVVMAALFESILFPLAVISSILYAVVGVFWFFFLTGTQFSVMAMIGILVLMGVVVNNGIVLVDHINHLRSTGFARHDAIVQAGKDRIRPILMTVATTILGLIPLSVGDTTIGGDSNSPPYYPMARAVIGGLAFSTIVSLLILPTIYIGLDNLSRWGQNSWRSAGVVRRRFIKE
ncbi:MAG: efflux RND transporter permease subunit [Gammaproteobacteria bacterium]|nr:efflux RND transporter permease subunit [Gammaproteobacteria bacterium]